MKMGIKIGSRVRKIKGYGFVAVFKNYNNEIIVVAEHDLDAGHESDGGRYTHSKQKSWEEATSLINFK